MLEDSLFESIGRKKTRKPVTVVVSAAAHVATIAVLALIPLVQTQAITMPALDLSLWAPRSEPAKSPQPVTAQPRVQERLRPDAGAFVEPERIPGGISYEPVQTTLPLLPSSDIGTTRSVLSEILGRNAEAAPPAAAPPQPPTLPAVPAPVVTKPVRIGGTVQEGMLVHQVRPTYPPLAKQARVQGLVVMEAVISRDGTIQDLRVVSGHPLLTRAAVEAAQQWRYRPTLLNGEPVEVITTITVNFTFQ